MYIFIVLRRDLSLKLFIVYYNISYRYHYDIKISYVIKIIIYYVKTQTHHRIF